MHIISLFQIPEEDLSASKLYPLFARKFCLVGRMYCPPKEHMFPYNVVNVMQTDIQFLYYCGGLTFTCTTLTKPF